MNYEFYGVAVAGLVIIWLMLCACCRSAKRRFDSIDRQMDAMCKIFDSLDSHLDKMDGIIISIEGDIIEIKERMAFLRGRNSLHDARRAITA